MSEPGKHSNLRYVLYAFLAIFLFTAGGIGFLVWKFTPLYTFDEKTDQVSFLGGYVQIDGKQGSLKVGRKTVNDTQEVRHFEGKTLFRDFAGEHGPFAAENAQLLIRIRNGNLDLLAAPGEELEWKCQTSPLGEPPQVEQVRKQMVLDLSRGRFGRCTVALPARLTVAVDAQSGRIEVVQPAFDLLLTAEASKVIYRRDPALAYRFEPRLESTRMLGLQGFPPPSSAPGAVWAGLTIHLGSVVLE